MKIKLFLLLSSIFLMLSCRTEEDPFIGAYKRSVAWLWSQQSEDGAWHSKTHNVLEDGKVLTPYILYYLLQVPDSIYTKDDDAVERGIRFVTNSIDSARVDSTGNLNYPNYSAAYALRLLIKMQRDTARQRLLASYLRDQQFLQHRGFHFNHIAYGGWGYGEPDLPYGEHGHVDLSHFRRVFTALKEYYRIPGNSNEQIDPHGFGWRTVPLFIASVQRQPTDKRLYDGCYSRAKLPYDGGFVSSLATLSTNKSQPVEIPGAGIHYPSYATATCDGLLAMLAVDLKNETYYADAVKWLTDHQRIDIIEGLSEDDPEQWYRIMHYYHWAVRAEAMRAAGIEGPWEKDLRKALVEEQQPDGFYINPIGGVNKEDDPLMATVFCVQAFTALTQ
jgi:hypothetical protein